MVDDLPPPLNHDTYLHILRELHLSTAPLSLPCLMPEGMIFLSPAEPYPEDDDTDEHADEQENEDNGPENIRTR